MTYSSESTQALHQVRIYQEERGVKATYINTIQDNTLAPVNYLMISLPYILPIVN